MKFFLVIPTLKQGGAERVISELGNYFITQGVDVEMVLLAESDDFYHLDDSICIHRLGFVNEGKIGKILSIIKTFFKLRGLLKKNNPDKILCFMDKYNIFTLLSALFLKIDVFISDRSNPKLKINFLMYMAKKLIYPFAKGIIAQTTLAKDVIQKITNHKNIIVLPNPVKAVNLYSDVGRDRIILNVGRLVPEKGQKYLIETFYNLHNKDWKLVILGEGPLRERLESQIIELNLSNSVIMPGSVKNIDHWMAKSSIFVLSSISEGFPNVLIEAMSAGVPCISFDCNAGPRDIIQNNINGILVETGNVSSLKESIDLLIKNKDFYSKISKNSLEARVSYNMETIGLKYLNFILGK